METVDIILVNYNRLQDTLACIESIKNNTYKQFRIVIVDNGSKFEDWKTLQSLNSYEIEVIHNNTNLGYAGGANEGIRFVLDRHPYSKLILLLDNDTIVDSQFLTELVRAIDLGNDMASSIVYRVNNGALQYVGGRLNIWREVILPVVWPQIRKHMDRKLTGVFSVDHTSFWSLLIKREVFNKIGLLNDKLFWSWEDIDFCFRAKQHDIKLVNVSYSKIFHKSRSQESNNGVLQYYSTRNKFYLVKTYLPRWHYPLFILYITTFHAAFCAIYYLLWKRRCIPFVGFCKGILDGLNGKLG